MSYIRCTSNPEGLYIYGTTNSAVHGGKGKTYISISASNERVSRNKGQHVYYPDNQLCPTPDEFYDVCEQYAKRWGDLDKPISSGEFSIREVQTCIKTERILTDEQLKEWNEKADKAWRDGKYKTASNFRTRTKVGLFWRDRSIVLWETTWWYVIDNVVSELKRDRRDKAKAKQAKRIEHTNASIRDGRAQYAKKFMR